MAISTITGASTGSTGTVITTGSSGQVIPKAALPTGSVLQVVNATYSTYTTFSSSTYADSGLTASITPTSSTSKILVIASINGTGKAGSNTALGARLLRNASVISNMDGDAGFDNSAGNNSIGSVMISYLDSPATTSSTTYKVQCNSLGNAASSRINDYYAGAGDSVSTITLMEISA